MEIGQYHGAQPEWRRTTSTKTGDLFGIELEVEHLYDRRTAANALDNVDFGTYHAPLVERDGSLDPVLGIEIICPPLPLEEVRREDGYISRIMSALRRSGVPDQQRDVCGMHVNVNVVDWTPQEKLLVQWALNAFDTLLPVNGKRPTNQYTATRPRFHYSWVPGGGLTLSTYPGTKHSAAYLRQAGPNEPMGTGAALVMEARFPKSTLEIKDLHTAIDYIMAVRDWVREAPNHTAAGAFLTTVMNKTVIMEALFVRWCLKQRPHVLTHVVDEQGAENLYKLIGNGKRLAVVTRTYEQTPATEINPTTTGFARSGDPTGDKAQLLRIGTFIGKGAGLEGTAAIDRDGFPNGITLASVRARR